MTSRQDIVDLDFNSKFPDVVKCIVENNYSRIPVYQNSIDNVRGILYIKDLLPYISKPASFRWQSLIRPPYFVPETKKIDDLLRDFQENKVHIAIVVDEFGGTSGLITLEDILEEIVGEINDEYDEEEKTYVRINSNTYVFEGKTLLSDFFKIMDLDTETFEEVEGDADSLAGLLLEIKGDFPELHERIDFENFTFEVTELDGHRISKIKVILHENRAGGEHQSEVFISCSDFTSLPAVLCPANGIVPLHFLDSLIPVGVTCVCPLVPIVIHGHREEHAYNSAVANVVKIILIKIYFIVCCVPIVRCYAIRNSLVKVRIPCVESVICSIAFQQELHVIGILIAVLCGKIINIAVVDRPLCIQLSAWTYLVSNRVHDVAGGSGQILEFRCLDSHQW
jgi:Mg2+/Co2+ transporter CorC